MIIETLFSLFGKSILIGALLGFVYAVVFVFSKKMYYRTMMNQSKRHSIYSSFIGSFARSALLGVTVVTVIRKWHLNGGAVIGMFFVVFLCSVALLSMSIYEH